MKQSSYCKSTKLSTVKLKLTSSKKSIKLNLNLNRQNKPTVELTRINKTKKLKILKIKRLNSWELNLSTWKDLHPRPSRLEYHPTELSFSSQTLGGKSY